MNSYTSEKIQELKKVTKTLTRSAGVKYVADALSLSPRQARRVYSKYLEENVSSDVSAPVAKRKIKRLFMDIETSPNIVMSWRIGYKINLDHDNILQERAIICIGYKWEHENEAHILHWDKDHNDKEMLSKFLEIVNEADEIIAHNGDSFDMPWFKTRCLYHGLNTIPDYKTVDTLQWARRKFYFNSNRLDYIARFLGIGGKLHTSFGLWKEVVLNSCPDALKKMLDYCKKDVVLLEQVWKRLSTAVNVKTHEGALNGGPKWSCPKDGSLNVKPVKTRMTANGSPQYQFQCLDCGRYYTVGAPAYNEYLEYKNGLSGKKS